MSESPLAPPSPLRYDWGSRAYTDPPPLGDDQWNELVKRGDKLLQIMMEPTETANQSVFTDFPNLYTTWGYSGYEQDGPELDFEGKGVEAALRAINVSVNQNDWITHHIQHNPKFNKAPDPQTYQVGGKTYRATGARYQTVLNVKDGIMI
ncbi:hypothetical protein BKA66DRAFT_564883 [Pyrenochaeta sp. MPI-SDFR-AT-0127]|nr:hypothetical protein BKA66DRAFT_564883 [Pyrenochaeta sp. MPI-SDFR-AT-0127]